MNLIQTISGTDYKKMIFQNYGMRLLKNTMK